MVKVKRVVNRAISKNIETKFLQTNQAATAQDVNGTFTNLTLVTQNQTDQSRIGDKLTPKALDIRYRIALPSTLPDYFNLIRVVIFRWKQNTLSVSPTQAYLLNTTASVLSPLSQYNYDTTKNFQILYDRVHYITTYDPSMNKKLMINLRKQPNIQFDSTNTIGNNHIWIYCGSDSQAAGHPTLEYCARFTFSDG